MSNRKLNNKKKSTPNSFIDDDGTLDDNSNFSPFTEDSVSSDDDIQQIDRDTHRSASISSPTFDEDKTDGTPKSTQNVRKNMKWSIHWDPYLKICR